jgi:hypothetical protein
MPDPIQDVTNSPNPPAASAGEPAKPPVSAQSAAQPTVPAVTADADALEVGRILLDSGYSKEQINQLLDAPKALEALRYAVENDPKEFIRTLERNNPAAGEKFLDELSKLYVDRYDRSGAPASKDGKPDANAEIMDEVRRLQEQVGEFRTKAEQQAQASAMAQVQARYAARVDDMFNQIPSDKFPLTNYEKELIKGKLSADLAADPNTVKRIMNGNFADVPRQFSRILEGISTDRKTAAESEKAKREASNKVGFPQFSGGPAELPKDFYTPPDSTSSDDIWNTDGLVKVLEQTR